MQKNPAHHGLDISRLAAPDKRRYIPPQTDFNDIEHIKTLYTGLMDRPLKNADDLEAFLLHRSELEAAARQHRAVLYIRMTCQTDDAERTAVYRRFIEQIEPLIEDFDHQLNVTYLAARKRVGQGPASLAVYERKLRADVDLFRRDNIQLQAEESLLIQDYQTLTGGLTATFEGQEQTLSALQTVLYDTDRSRRENVWRLIVDCRNSIGDQLDEIFDKLLDLRNRIAHNAGCGTYRDYKFRQYHRFDYTPEDCKAFHTAVQDILVPVQRQMWQRRSEEMDLCALRPWDLLADPQGRKPLRPFESPDQFGPAICQVLKRLDADLGGQFAEMQQQGLLDLHSRKGKAPGGYQYTLDEVRKPFIFMNAAGSDDDVRVLLHEAGHAFHSLACADQPLVAYRHAPLEFAEVASMSMERLAATRLDVLYQPDELKRRRRHVAEMTVRLLLSVAANDAFQHWLYENPIHTPAQRQAQWVHLQNTYGQDALDWSGLEEKRGAGWQSILHFYQVPFYYIEYGIAQLGALAIWQHAQADEKTALNDYKKAIALGGSCSLPELFAVARVPFDFSHAAIGRAAELLRAEWQASL